MKTPRSVEFPAFVALVVLALFSCRDSAARMGRGFRLPEGDESRGKAAFVELQCCQCHTVAGMDLPKTDTPSAISYELGGEVRVVKSYGELVTAIIQPQHVVSTKYLQQLEETQREGAASPMPDFNARVTVAQLADIVTFLHARYQKKPPPGVNYPYYLP
jgi:mono/diheme cytochrome c family protein